MGAHGNLGGLVVFTKYGGLDAPLIKSRHGVGCATSLSEHTHRW